MSQTEQASSTSTPNATRTCLQPKQVYNHAVEAGVARSKWRLDKAVAMGILGACYVGFGFTLTLIVGGQIPKIQQENPGLYSFILGAVGFPLGLTVMCILGGDLFTGNCCYFICALYEGRVSLLDVLQSWVLSWFINLAGSIIMALIVYWAWIFRNKTDFAFSLAEEKAGNPFGVVLCKGILANWLVNLAVWCANSAQDVTGKAVAVYLPISAFVSIGGEQVIANQFLFALYKFLGGQMSVNHIIVRNLIPATIGNIIGGAFFVGTMYSFGHSDLFDCVYDKTGITAVKEAVANHVMSSNQKESVQIQKESLQIETVNNNGLHHRHHHHHHHHPVERTDTAGTFLGHSEYAPQAANLTTDLHVQVRNGHV